MYELTLYSLAGVSLGITVLIQGFTGYRLLTDQTVARLYSDGPTIVVSQAQAEALATLVGSTIVLDLYSREEELIGEICFNPSSVTQYRDLTDSSPALSIIYTQLGTAIVLKSALEAALTTAGLLPATTP